MAHYATMPRNFEFLEQYNMQNGDILESLTLQLRRFIGIPRSAIIRKPRTPLYKLEVRFVKENSNSELPEI